VRLTLINQFYAPDISPTARLAASLAEHRAALGDQVTVLAGLGSYVAEAAPTDAKGHANPRIVRVWTPGLGKGTLFRRLADYLAFYVGALVRAVALKRQDVVVSLTTPPYIVCAALLHRRLHRRVRVVLWNMDCYPEIAERSGALAEGGLPSHALRWLNRAILGRVDRVVCLDGAMRELLEERYSPVRRSLPAIVIPNWERQADYPEAGPGRGDASDRPFVVLYMGNAGVGHAFDTVLASAKALQTRAIRFSFVGGGSRWAEIRSHVAEAGLGNVAFRSYVPMGEVRAVMALASCGLITLRDEARGVMSPSKLHAYLAVGLPILYIGPPGSNVDEAIVRFGCGASIRHGDTEAVVAFLEGLRQDPSRLAELRRRSRQAFDEAYCDDRTLPQFDRVLDGLG
jgi:putative colanic acid biosynthesis glycosyltransferase WcaI